VREPEWGHPNLNARRREALASGQHPFAIVVCCADSRVPPELVFDQGLGDLFVVRTAGHVLDDAALGTIEYGVLHGFGSLVVLGHGKCGAVDETIKVVVDGKQPPGGKLDCLIDYIAPAVEWAHLRDDGIRELLLERSVQMNARSTVAALMRNPVVEEAVGAGKLRVLPMEYDLAGSVNLVERELYVARREFMGYNNLNASWHSDAMDLAELEYQRGQVYPSRLLIRSGTVIDAVQMSVEANGERVDLNYFGGTGGGQHWIEREALTKVRRVRVFGATLESRSCLGGIEFTLEGGARLEYGQSRDVDLGEWLLAPGEVPLGFAGRWRDMVEGLSLLTGYRAGTPLDVADGARRASTSVPSPASVR
jgi:carbonic anhydrase